MMTCGKPWIPPRPEEAQKVADLFAFIFPDPEMRAGYASVLKSGLTGTRPENFTVGNGGGHNGKGVINENTANCAGNYAVEGHLALLTKPIRDGPNPEAAGLHRKRLAIFSDFQGNFAGRVSQSWEDSRGRSVSRYGVGTYGGVLDSRSRRR